MADDTGYIIRSGREETAWSIMGCAKHTVSESRGTSFKLETKFVHIVAVWTDSASLPHRTLGPMLDHDWLYCVEAV